MTTVTTKHRFCPGCNYNRGKGVTYGVYSDGRIKVDYANVCKSSCVPFLVNAATVKETDVIDPTPREIDGINEAKARAADYLQKSGLMQFPLVSFGPEQVDEFLRVIIGGYTEGLAASDEIPF